MSAAVLLVICTLSAATSPPAAVIGTDLDEAHAIGKLLRCPVCQGMPIAESPSEMAQDMMKRVQAMLAQGQSRQEILDYFANRYGEWVLLEPRPHGMNLALWILPFAALLLGLIVILRLARRHATSSPGERPEKAAIDPALQAIRDEVNE